MSSDRGPTIAEAAHQWLGAVEAGAILNRSGEPFKPASIRGYKHCLRVRVLPELGHLRLRELTTPAVQRWVDRLVAQKLAPPTVDSALTPLKSIFRWALQRGLTTTNPTVGIAKPAVRSSVKVVASPTQAAAMIAAVPPAIASCGRRRSTPACAVAS